MRGVHSVIVDGVPCRRLHLQVNAKLSPTTFVVQSASPSPFSIKIPNIHAHANISNLQP